MTPRITHDSDDLVYACPDCDVAGKVYRRVDSTRSYDDAEHCCHRCGASFAEPVEREANHADPQAYTDDGLPSGLSPAAKQAVRATRGGSD